MRAFDQHSYDRAVTEFHALADALDEDGLRAVVRNLFTVAQTHPNERTARALWHHLRVHQPKEGQCSTPTATAPTSRSPAVTAQAESV